MARRSSSALCAALLAVLASCGGGEDGAALPPPDVAAEVRDAGSVDAPGDPDVPLPPADVPFVDDGGGATDIALPDAPPTPDAAGETTPPTDVGLPPALAEGLAEGKRWLALGQPYRAQEIFQALEVAYPASADARFGAALSLLVDAVEQCLSILSLPSQLAAYDTLPPDPSQNEWLAETLHQDFGKLARGFEEALARLEALRTADLRFTVEAVPVYNVAQPFLTYRGTFDQGDVHLMRAVTRMALFVLAVVRVQDWRADLLTVVGEARDRSGDIPMIQLLTYVLGRLLAEPTFLAVHPVDGAALYANARELLAGVSGDLDAALDWWRAEGPPDESDVSGLRVPASGIGGTLVLQAGVRVRGDGTVAYRALLFELPAAVPEAFRTLAEAARTPGMVLPFAEEPRWVLATVVAVLFRTGLVGRIELGGIVLDPDMVTTSSLADLLRSMVPLPFAFDFGTLLATPTGLRSFLPRANDAGDGIIIEWECADELADGWPDGTGGVLCDSAEGTVDGPHFVGTPDETPPDGRISPLPYLAFLDPSMDGFLYVDAVAVGLPEHGGGEATEAPVWLPADQTSLNAGLAVGLGPILGLLSLAQP